VTPLHTERFNLISGVIANEAKTAGSVCPSVTSLPRHAVAQLLAALRYIA
jgi:hypothetical protein